ncbi:Tachykinin-like peptides receptor 86C [Nymphon striatum]|nr:Tachykinin-like peptides receptor 86C [Nymphon striatum]
MDNFSLPVSSVVTQDYIPDCVNYTPSSVTNSVFDNKTSLLCANFTEPNSNGTTLQLRPFVLPFWQKLSWTVCFSLMVIVAALGNILVIWVILAHRRMRTVTNYFLLNLSIADLMMATLNVIFNFIYMLDSHWPFGQKYCQINNFVSKFDSAGSIDGSNHISQRCFNVILHNNHITQLALMTLNQHIFFRSPNRASKGIPIHGDRLIHLRFVDDVVVLLSESPQQHQPMIQELRTANNKCPYFECLRDEVYISPIERFFIPKDINVRRHIRYNASTDAESNSLLYHIVDLVLQWNFVNTYSSLLNYKRIRIRRRN